MLTLYHCPDARSFRALWALEELGRPYALKVLPFPPRVHAKEFLELNPLGTVPLLIDGDVRMTESAAICQYLATQGTEPSDLAVRPEETDYGTWLNALHQSDATLTFPQTLVIRYGTLEPADRRQPQVVEDYTRWFYGRLRAVDTALTDRAYLAASRFTVADIAVGYALKLAEIIGLSSEFTPRVADYWARLSDRPAYRAAMEKQKVETQDEPRLEPIKIGMP